MSCRRGRRPSRGAPRSACRCRRRARGSPSCRPRSARPRLPRGTTGALGRRPRPPGRTTVQVVGCSGLLIVRSKLPDSLCRACPHPASRVRPDERTDPLAWLTGLEGVPSAFAATRDGIDVMLRDRGLRRTTPEQTAESLLRGAHASAVLEGSVSSLDDVRSGSGDELARAAVRVSTELLVAGAGAGPLARRRRSPGCTRSPGGCRRPASPSPPRPRNGCCRSRRPCCARRRRRR